MLKPHLKRDLNLLNLFTLAFGSIIGVGWITVLSSWLMQAGALGAIIAFALGGIVILLIGLCYAEAAAMYPVSGGEVAYLFEMYGVGISFFAGWFLALNYIGLTAFEAISVGWILSAIFPGLEGPVMYSVLGADVRLTGLLVGLAITVVITLINYYGAKSTARFQNWMTFSLLAISVVFIIAGIGWGDPANLKPLFVSSGGGLGGGVLVGIIAVFATTPFWFAGFDTIPQAMGEKANEAPLRMLPYVIGAAIGMSLLFYCLVIVAATMTLPREQLLALDLPVAGAFQAGFHSPLFGKIVLLAGFCGLITTWNAMFFAGSRLIFALGRAHMIPGAFGKIHPSFGSPAMAVLFVGFVGACLSLLGRNSILPIVNIGATSMALVYLLVAIGIIRLRISKPEIARPYKLPGKFLLPGVAAFFCLIMLVVSLLEPYRSAGGAVPIEWILLVVWGVIGGGFWVLARPSRNAVTHEERRNLILG